MALKICFINKQIMTNITNDSKNLLKNFIFDEKNDYNVPTYILNSIRETYKCEYDYKMFENLKLCEIYNDLINLNDFMPKQYKKILTLNLGKMCIKIQYKNITLFFDKNQEINYNLFIHICLFFQKLTNDYEKNITIYYLLTDFVKLIPSKAIFTSKQINSGVTSFSHNHIFIWRKEEIIKVTFHELVHYFGIDKSSQIELLANFIKNNFNIKGYDSPFESYTEVLATIFNCVFCSYYLKVDVHILLNYEKQMLNFQCNKILKIINGTYQQLTNKKSNLYITQETNCVSYFFIKNIIFNNLSLFFKIINQHIFFNDIIAKYVDLLQYGIANNHKHLLCTNTTKPPNELLKKTMRMTCVEYNYQFAVMC